MGNRGRTTLRRSLLATAGAVVLLSPPAAWAAGVHVGGVGLPGGASVPGVSVDVPGVEGPEVNVPPVQVPDVAGLGETVNGVAPAVGGLLPGNGGGGSSSTPSADPATPAPPSTPADQTPAGTGGTPSTGPSADPGTGSSGSASGRDGGRDRGARGPSSPGNATGGPAGSSGQAGGARAAEKPQGEASTEPTISSRIGKVISALPTGILIGLFGLAVIGLLMTGRSAWFARASRRLTLQRHALQEDVGVLQAALVPDLPPSVGGVGVSVAYRPATGPAAGGDFHDVFEIDRNKIGIVVGDVAGHGRDAVPRTGVVRYTIRAYLEAGLEPRLALRLADRALRADFAGHGEFATAVAATYDRSTSRLVYSCAGHPHPIVLGPHAPDPVETHGSPPIGVARASGSRQTMFALGPHSELWFFSDGLTEAQSEEEGAMVGREGLRRLLESHPDPEELLGELPSNDDLTVCRLRIPEPEGIEPFSVETLLIEHDHDPEEVSQFLGACGMAAFECDQALDRIRVESKFEGEILVRVSRLASVQHWRVERIQPALGQATEEDSLSHGPRQSTAESA